ncbi:MAG: hypothetical protein IH872_00930 [Chloroflexi bacterium]|nr:hypothetical protein [Chloroflexota bacterium]
MLIGDLLLSGPPLPGVTTVIPTADDLSMAFLSSSPVVPRDLCQKIAVVGDNLVVGWAGSYDVARDVISELVRLNAARPFTNELLQRHFDSLSPSVWLDPNVQGRQNAIGLVGFVRDGNRVAQFGRSNYQLPTQLFGTVGLLGTWWHDVEEFLKKFQQLPESRDRPTNALEQSLSFGLQLTGTFLNLEMATLDSVKKLYGGGYEIAASIAGKFEKLDDVTYVFWETRTDGTTVRLNLVPRRVFRYAYQDDLLVIRAVSFQGEGPTDTVRQDLFPVRPVYRDLRPTEITSPPVPTLNTRWLCNFIFVSLPNGRTGILTLVLYKATGGDRWVKFFDNPIGVGVQQEFLDLVVREFWEEFGIRVEY